jgi:alpha-D-ribose 1-methylphosphonate 5-triphosphate diphosphatase
MWLTDLTIVLPDETLDRGAIHIAGGRIAEIVAGEVRLNGGPALRCSGLIAMPGIVDMHGDMLEQEAEPRPGAHFPLDLAVLELDKRLAASGVTTAYAALSFWDAARRERQRSSERACRMIDTLDALRESLLIDMRIHARYEVTTPSVAPALVDLLSHRKIHLLSLMDHTPGQGQYRSVEQYVDVIARWRGVDRDEVAAETSAKIELAQEQTVWALAAGVVACAAAQGVPVASHDDDTAIKVARMADLGVAISEFPVTLEAAREARRRRIAVAMGAPNVLRGGSHTGNLSALDAIRAGVVDMLAADYAPAALLQAVFIIVRQGALPLHMAVRLVAQNPAAALGLADRGRIEVGLSADLALVEPAVRPRVRATFRQGVPIYQDGTMPQRAAHR